MATHGAGAHVALPQHAVAAGLAEQDARPAAGLAGPGEARPPRSGPGSRPGPSGPSTSRDPGRRRPPSRSARRRPGPRNTSRTCRAERRCRAMPTARRAPAQAPSTLHSRPGPAFDRVGTGRARPSERRAAAAVDAPGALAEGAATLKVAGATVAVAAPALEQAGGDPAGGERIAGRAAAARPRRPSAGAR